MTDTGQPALPEPRTDTMTVAEAAVRASVSERTMRRYVEKKPLWAYKERGRWIIRRAEFLAWLADRPEADTDRPAIRSTASKAVRAESEALRTDLDRERTRADEAEREARQWREQAQAWREQAERAQATVQQLAEALTRLSLPAHEPVNADRPDADRSEGKTEVGERR